MSHVIRDGESMTPRRAVGSRIAALAATFMLLMAGGIVTRPGLIFAGGQSHPGGGTHHDGNDDGHDGHDDGHDDKCDDGHHGDESEHGDDESEHDDDAWGDSNDSTTYSSSGWTKPGGGKDGGGKDGDGKDDDGHDDGHHDDGHHDDGHHDGDDDDDDDNGGCDQLATLTLDKVLINDDGGMAELTDFSLVATSVGTGTAVIDAPDPDADPAVGVSADVDATDSYELSETGPTDGYVASDWSCDGGTLDGSVLTLNKGDDVTCTITNDDIAVPPAESSITVVKQVSDAQWGGALQGPDFQLTIDGGEVNQLIPNVLPAGSHVIGEQQRPGYTQVGIECYDLFTIEPVAVGVDGSVELAEGQNLGCAVINEDLPAKLTVVKTPKNDSGLDLGPEAFQLQIDGDDVPQNEAQLLSAGTHVIGEVPVAGYTLVGIDCVETGNPQATVPYTDGLTLANGQDVTCTVTNDDEPLDLALTKTSDDQTHIAGGAPFDYTISVQNVGPRDASAGEPITVTDVLPAGLAFVDIPDNCTANGQVLTCDLDPADFTVESDPVDLVISVRALPSAQSGTYTNLAYVGTEDDPACIGNDCVPTCDTGRNNIDCASTVVDRQATIAVEKVDDVSGTVAPGATYHYSITVTNNGPSTVSDIIVTDSLPSSLQFVSVAAASPWQCTNNANAVSCSHTPALAAGASAPVITLTVKVDPAFVGNSITNDAAAMAVVDPITESDPQGTVATAKDDETTSVARSADLSIDKSVSASSAVAGDTFDWVLDIVNHGPDTATNVVVSDTVPSAFQIVSVMPAGGLSCTNTASKVDCTVASLANGASAKVTIQVRVNATASTGPVSNTATVTSDTPDPTTPNNSDTASITVTAQAASGAPVPGGSGSGVGLPRTGNSSLGGPLTLAGLLIGGGFVSLVIARRRRTARIS